MKLLAPINSYQSLIENVEAGADEVYVGVETIWGKIFHLQHEESCFIRLLRWNIGI